MFRSVCHPSPAARLGIGIVVRPHGGCRRGHGVCKTGRAVVQFRQLLRHNLALNLCSWLDTTPGPPITVTIIHHARQRHSRSTADWFLGDSLRRPVRERRCRRRVFHITLNVSSDPIHSPKWITDRRGRRSRNSEGRGDSGRARGSADRLPQTIASRQVSRPNQSLTAPPATGRR